MDICPKCGLPLQACVCEEIAKTEQRIHLHIVKKRFGKLITILSGFKDINLKTIAKNLKQELACGGTIKNKTIELQGNHLKNAKKALINHGFQEDLIEIV